MGDSLFQDWLDEEIEDIQVVLITIGINGILAEFELWLLRKGHIKKE